MYQGIVPVLDALMFTVLGTPVTSGNWNTEDLNEVERLLKCHKEGHEDHDLRGIHRHTKGHQDSALLDLVGDCLDSLLYGLLIRRTVREEYGHHELAVG